MKKLVVLFLVMSAFTFVSCGDDDDNFGGLLGKWKFYSEEHEDGKVKFYNPNVVCRDYVEFKSDGTYKMTYYSDDCKSVDTLDGEYSVDGNIMNVKKEGTTGKVRYEIKGKKLIAYDSGITYTYVK